MLKSEMRRLTRWTVLVGLAVSSIVVVETSPADAVTDFCGYAFYVTASSKAAGSSLSASAAITNNYAYAFNQDADTRNVYGYWSDDDYQLSGTQYLNVVNTSSGTYSFPGGWLLMQHVC